MTRKSLPGPMNRCIHVKLLTSSTSNFPAVGIFDSNSSTFLMFSASILNRHGRRLGPEAWPVGYGLCWLETNWAIGQVAGNSNLGYGGSVSR